MGGTQYKLNVLLLFGLRCRRGRFRRRDVQWEECSEGGMYNGKEVQKERCAMGGKFTRDVQWEGGEKGRI